MRAYYLSWHNWKMLYVPGNMLGLVSRSPSADNCWIDRFVFDFDINFIRSLDAIVRKHGLDYLEKKGWKKNEVEVEDDIMEKAIDRCFQNRIDLAKRTGKMIFYNAINQSEYAQTDR